MVFNIFRKLKSYCFIHEWTKWQDIPDFLSENDKNDITWQTKVCIKCNKRKKRVTFL